MAKASSRPSFFGGSVPPQARVTRLAEPERWDTPFSGEMTDDEVNQVLASALFAGVKPERFPARIPLRGILKNDARIRDFLPGEIVVRQGDYGHSAFVILEGSVRIFLREPDGALVGRREPVRASVWNSFRRWLRRPYYPEQARRRETGGGGPESRIFLQDIPGVLDPDWTVRMEAGELFGEIAALSRTPRTATCVAEGPAKLLEIRWQGLRELRNYSPEWKAQIDQRYRQRSLLRHLQETPLFFNLDATSLQQVADATRFETVGEFDWYSGHNRGDRRDREHREHEVMIAREGDFPSGLLLVRSGFARVSRNYNQGERTGSYLGKGQSFGLPELVAGWRTGQPVPLNHNLRALGYTDLLFIPAAVLEQHVLPRLPTAELDALVAAAVRGTGAGPGTWARPDEQNLIEFVVAGRFINGRTAMLIDLDRCTHCDDCVRACAATHDNNPRFIRHGPETTGLMVASACMHCVDPVCMVGCPTGAIQRGVSVGGEILINPDTCIGCGICAQSCPYGTIQMVLLRDEEGQPVLTEETGAPIRRATKCDLCVDQPTGPACVNACPHDALARADMREIGTLADWLRR
jgi:Fe-S-cluster-containing dehydrogenase component/CRP-like cAMP-binding protein